MERYQFLVQGSAAEPYEVVFEREGRNLTATCSCPAGQFGNYCKHRFNILAGLVKGISSGNEAEVDKVVELLSGTDVESALNEARAAEQVLSEAKKTFAAAKKKLARTMID